MAAAKKPAAQVTVTAPETPEGYEYIRAPLARNNEQDFVIGVNGVNTTIPQDGEYHLVRSEVAYEFNRAMQAQRKFYDLQDRLHASAQIV